jgi:hypothetical protein
MEKAGSDRRPNPPAVPVLLLSADEDYGQMPRSRVTAATRLIAST